MAGVTDIFEDRYGAGARSRLVSLFRQPCVTFAQIAAQFGVSRERVRQWQLEILPDAPRGRERRRLCGLSHHRRQLLNDPLFRAFYRQARSWFPRDRLQLIPSGDGFRKRMVRLEGTVVALKVAGRAAGSAGAGAAGSYILAGYRGPAAFVYCRLTDTDFLFMPVSAFPAGGTTLVDTDASKYRAFKNTFAALSAAGPRSESDRTAQGAAAAWAPTPARCAASTE